MYTSSDRNTSTHTQKWEMNFFLQYQRKDEDERVERRARDIGRMQIKKTDGNETRENGGSLMGFFQLK